MTENNFQTAVKCGSVALVACVVLNIWVVMRNVEVYRDATRADVKLQQLAVREQVLRAVLQDFAARANSDPQIAGIFRRAQTVGLTNAAPTNLNPQ